MPSKDYTYRIFRDALFNDQDIFLSIETDCPNDHLTPFSLSFELFVTSEGVYVEPACTVWVMKDGEVEPLDIHKHSHMARRMAVPLFAFLAKTDFRAFAEDRLRTMMAESEGETFTFALCADGLALVGDKASSIAYHHGPGSSLAMLRRTNESEDEQDLADERLLACVKAIVSATEDITDATWSPM